jgi:hypothetical protein
MSTIQYQTNTKADSASGDVLQKLITTPDEKINNIIARRKDKQYNSLTKRQTI